MAPLKDRFQGTSKYAKAVSERSGLSFSTLVLFWIKKEVADLRSAHKRIKDYCVGRLKRNLFKCTRPWSELKFKFYRKSSNNLRTRYLRESGLFGRVSARKQLLSKSQVKQRIQWCNAYLSFTAVDWIQLIFYNESRIAKLCNTRRYVWRPINSRYKSKYSCKMLKYLGISLLVWGAIKADGYRILIQCPPRLGS